MDKKINITIKSNSSTAKVFKKYMAEKAAFKTAVMTGNVSSYVKQSGTKFDSPISITL